MVRGRKVRRPHSFGLHLICEWVKAEHVHHEYDQPHSVLERRVDRFGGELHVQECFADAGFMTADEPICLGVDTSLRIPTMPISRSSESRSFIPIDPDQCGVGAPLDAFLISVFSPDVKHG
jgi:hypothetical protein